MFCFIPFVHLTKVKVRKIEFFSYGQLCPECPVQVFHWKKRPWLVSWVGLGIWVLEVWGDAVAGVWWWVVKYWLCIVGRDVICRRSSSIACFASDMLGFMSVISRFSWFLGSEAIGALSKWLMHKFALVIWLITCNEGCGVLPWDVRYLSNGMRKQTVFSISTLWVGVVSALLVTSGTVIEHAALRMTLSGRVVESAKLLWRPPLWRPGRVLRRRWSGLRKLSRGFSSARVWPRRFPLAPCLVVFWTASVEPVPLGHPTAFLTAGVF